MPALFKHAILIDDEDISSFIVKTWLQKRGMAEQYHIFANPETALAFLMGHQSGELPDLVLVDIHMPIMNGLQLLKEAFDQPRPAYRKIYWYVLTSSLHVHDQQQALSFPIDGYLIKPLDQPQTEQIIRNVEAKRNKG